MSTFMAQPETFQRRWYVIDATDQVVGRLAVQIATILRGKHRPDYTPHMDTGDFVVVINAEKVRFTGKKLETKIYDRYTHYAGGRRTVTAKDMLATIYHCLGIDPHTTLIDRLNRPVPLVAGSVVREMLG